MDDNLKQADSHFEFGENWCDYLRHVDEGAIAEAQRALNSLVPAEELQGSRFLDIGCGSGLHSLAAIRSGVSQVLAIDIDPDSVSATRSIFSRFAPEAPASVQVLSVFDADPDHLGLFDVVYSWGVLHHTGAMWEAIAKASRLVKPDGVFALAIYQKRPTCGAWTIEKRIYTKAGPSLRKLIRGVYKAAFYAGLAISGRNPAAYVRNYKSTRGMNFHTDVHDWLGGYPYESATPDEISSYLSKRGFEALSRKEAGGGIGISGTGCAEYSFRRLDE